MTVSRADGPAASSTSAAGGVETQAFLQLIKQKPPAKMDGLLHLVSDFRNDRYTVEEQRHMAETEAGRQLARALANCEGLKQKAREHAMSQNSKHLAKESALKYLDCLSYMSCPDRWARYTQCWTNISGLPPGHLRELQSKAGLEVVCQKERRALECCIGNLVSETVRSSAFVNNGYDRDCEDELAGIFVDYEQ